MVMKTFIAAACVATMAGGMVYFGTQPAESGGMTKIEGVVTAANETQQTRKIVSRYLGPAEAEVVAEAEFTGAEIDDNPYVVDSGATTDEAHPHPPIRKRKPKPEDSVPEDSVPEDSVFQFEVEVEVETETQTEIIDPEQVLPEPVSPIEKVETGPAADNFMQPPSQTEIPETEPVREIRPVPPRRRKPRTDHNSNANHPATQRINVVFEQAKNISQPDLRDRAYLDLADYAVSKGLFDEAEQAALKIGQVELRDTARSRIAMGLARYGKSEEAFALIEQVEVTELRDVMRLQVIEALLGTDGRR